MRREELSGVQVVALEGSLRDPECVLLEEELRRLLREDHRRVVLDFSGLSAVAAACLIRLLKHAHRFARAEGTVALAGLSPEVTHVARLIRLDQKLRLWPSLSEAVLWAGGSGWRP